MADSLPWFRMYSEFSTDQKVQMLSEPDQRRLIMLLCLRCNGNVTLHDDEVCFCLRVTRNEWAHTKALFIERGFINNENEILNWDKRQFKSDTSKNRVNAHRERKKQLSNTDVTLQKRKCNVLDTDTDTDTDNKKHIAKKINFFAGIDENIVNDYLAVRKAKKAPAVSKTVFDGLVRESNLAGITLVQALAVCCERNWVGFKAEWYAGKKKTPTRDESRTIAARSIFTDKLVAELSARSNNEKVIEGNYAKLE